MSMTKGRFSLLMGLISGIPMCLLILTVIFSIFEKHAPGSENLGYSALFFFPLFFLVGPISVLVGLTGAGIACFDLATNKNKNLRVDLASLLFNLIGVLTVPAIIIIGSTQP